MNLDFDLTQVATTEFGVGRRIRGATDFVAVPVDGGVQTVLIDMAKSTSDSVAEEVPSVAEECPSQPEFDPANKYASREYLVLSTTDDMTGPLAELHNADNLPLAGSDVEHLRRSFCYFARFRDGDGRRLTGMRRASQFKATLGKQNRLVQLTRDTLRSVRDPVFQLNAEFDLLIDAQRVHILHPASFRSLGNVDEAIAKAVPRNIEAIAQGTAYVNWSNIATYASSHPRAASLLASIRTRGFAENLDRAELESLCDSTGVFLEGSCGQIIVPPEHILPFLEVLDRRRYQIGLVPNSPEQYRASSRAKVGRSGP